jgi:2,3-bisphosphoglycerate-dependent phosphoglycerate mutase
VDIRTTLSFIRHGEGMANSTHRILDQCAGSGLTPQGIQQVHQLQQRLRITDEIQADAIVTSTFHRAHETAQILAPLWSVPLVLDDDLQELRYGVDDMTYADFNAHYGAFNVRDAPNRQKSPRGESWQQFTARATHAVERIRQTYAGQRVVLVTHGGVIRALLFLVLRLDLSRADWGRSQLDYTSITQWHHEQTETGARWSLLRWNDAAHLHLVPLAVSPAQANERHGHGDV